MSGIKKDEGKLPMGLLSSKWLQAVAAVLGFGQKKYSAHNWRKGLHFSRVYDAAMRHIVAWNDGEDLDPETGMSHLAHASCCLMFLYELSIKHKQFDDRFVLRAGDLDLPTLPKSVMVSHGAIHCGCSPLAKDKRGMIEAARCFLDRNGSEYNPGGMFCVCHCHQYHLTDSADPRNEGV